MKKAVDYYDKYIAATHPGPNDEIVMKVTALKQMLQMQQPKPAPEQPPADTQGQQPGAATNGQTEQQPQQPAAPAEQPQKQQEKKQGGKK